MAATLIWILIVSSELNVSLLQEVSEPKKVSIWGPPTVEEKYCTHNSRKDSFGGPTKSRRYLTEGIFSPKLRSLSPITGNCNVWSWSKSICSQESVILMVTAFWMRIHTFLTFENLFFHVTDNSPNYDSNYKPCKILFFIVRGTSLNKIVAPNSSHRNNNSSVANSCPHKLRLFRPDELVSLFLLDKNMINELAYP